MSRPNISVAVPALALRRAEAAAALGISVELFDVVRADLPTVRINTVTLYPTAGLQAWLDRNSATLADELLPMRHRRAA